MSILIKGMEIPTSCFQCEFRTKIDPNNLMCIISQKTFEDRFYHIEHRDESCPLVPVPEHGRLIDADAMQEEWYRLNFDRKISDGTLAYWNYQLSKMPTIIPADKEGE